MDADKTRANEAPTNRKPASAQDIKVTTSESTVGLELMTLLELHKKKLLIVAGVIVAALVVSVVYNHFVAQRELNAGEALLTLRPPIVGADRQKQVPADKYLQVVEQYAGTAAAKRALLLGAEAYFIEGKYDQAKAAFTRFLQENPGDALSSQADLGIAASLDAAGKAKEALEAYDLVRKRYAQEAGVSAQAKLSIGRLYENQGKYEPAFTVYREMLQAAGYPYNNNNSWLEVASMRYSDLAKAHPELVAVRPTPPVQPQLRPPLMPLTNRVVITNATRPAISNPAPTPPLMSTQPGLKLTNAPK
jgi:tetratricopeptide (TPR) repeat protein